MELPFDIFRNKLFLKPHESAEFSFAKKISEKDIFNYKETNFYKLRVGKVDWEVPGVANLPKGLKNKPPYWVMPWTDKKRKPLTFLDKILKTIEFRKKMNSFKELFKSINENGFDNSDGPIKGFLLINEFKEKQFIYTDGNRRLGILAEKCKREKIKTSSILITVKVVDTIKRDELLDKMRTLKIDETYNFGDEDAFKWFDCAFS